MMASSCPLHWGAMSTSSYDIRSGRVAYVTLCARARMFGHAEAELRLCTDPSEHCSLGVQALDDPASTRHLMRSIQESASPFIDSRGCGLDAVHVAILGPAGIRHPPRTVPP